MSNRAEEIAAEGPYTSRRHESAMSRRWVIDGPTDPHDWFLSDEQARKECARLNAAYKQGQQDRWISVEERLPEPMVKVLVHQQYDDDAFIAKLCNTRRGKPSKPYWYVPVPDAGYVDGDGYWDGDVDEAFAKITHWMPLPSPPNHEQP